MQDESRHVGLSEARLKTRGFQAGALAKFYKFDELELDVIASS